MEERIRVISERNGVWELNLNKKPENFDSERNVFKITDTCYKRSPKSWLISKFVSQNLVRP